MSAENQSICPKQLIANPVFNERLFQRFSQIFGSRSEERVLKTCASRIRNKTRYVNETKRINRESKNRINHIRKQVGERNRADNAAAAAAAQANNNNNNTPVLFTSTVKDVSREAYVFVTPNQGKVGGSVQAVTEVALHQQQMLSELDSFMSNLSY